MADKFPLIFNADVNQIQELSASVGLNLDSCGIKNVTSIGINTNQTSAGLFVKGNSGSNIETLTDGATITPNFSTANNFTVTLGGNRTLANPTGITTGQTGVIYVVQDGSGSRTLGIGSHYHFAGGSAPTFTTTAAAVDAIAYSVRSITPTQTSIFCNAVLDIKTTS